MCVWCAIGDRLKLNSKVDQIRFQRKYFIGLLSNEMKQHRSSMITYQFGVLSISIDCAFLPFYELRLGCISLITIINQRLIYIHCISMKIRKFTEK